MDSDSESDTRKVKLMLAVGVGFLFSLVTSCQELKYTMWGKKADGTVVAIEPVMVKVGRRSREEPRMQIEFTYQDSEVPPAPGMVDSTVKSRDQLPMDWDFGDAKPGGTIPIEFLAGDKTSARLVGHRNMTGVWFLIALGAILVLLFIKASYDAKRPL